MGGPAAAERIAEVFKSGSVVVIQLAEEPLQLVVVLLQPFFHSVCHAVSLVVKKSISEFSQSLYEAIIIVLAVSLFSLGRRSGYVISCCIPLILLGSFAAMFAMGIDLHKVSLGALVISLGMLVDDAIVVVELMEVKMSEGMERKA